MTKSSVLKFERENINGKRHLRMSMTNKKHEKSKESNHDNDHLKENPVTFLDSYCQVTTAFSLY